MPKRPGIVNRYVHLLEYIVLRLTGGFLGIIPVTWVYVFTNFLGWIAFSCIGIRRDVTMENLRRAYAKEKSEQELERIARASYTNIGMTFIEMVLMNGLKRKIPSMVDMSEADIMKRKLDAGRGMILISGHFGSWEVNGAAIGLMGIPVTVVGRRQSNEYVDRYVTEVRRGFGMKMISHGVSIRHLVKALKVGEAVGLISDQDAGKKGVFVTFFGRKASAPSGAAQLALKYHAPIVVSMTKRISPGRYKSIIREVAVYPDDSIESVTQRYTTVMEDIIRENPEQYFWMHRRWKTRPPGGADCNEGTIPAEAE